jgi:hypothetical protein
MPRISVTRTIAADPTSTALLVAGPTAAEQWSHPAASLRVQTPWRTPTDYVSRVVISTPGLPDVSGLLTLGYVPSIDGLSRTAASLRLDYAAVPGADATAIATEIREIADNLLATLTTLAEERASAA